MFRRSRSKKYLEAEMRLIDLQVTKHHEEIIKILLTLLTLLQSNKLEEARAYTIKISDLADLWKRNIKTYMTTKMANVYEAGARFSHSFQEVEKKECEVFDWLGEITQKTEEFRKKLKVSKNQEEIFASLDELLEKVSYDKRLSAFTNILRTTIMEFEMYRASTSVEKPITFFANLRLHPAVKGACEKLFIDGHYASAILEAYKALNNHVKKKSGQAALDGKDLMVQVLSFDYDQTTDQVRRKPLLQLNELDSRSSRDEQQGFMYLFMGSMLGIRNPKAHEIVEQKDPFRTLEYLSLASLLAKRVDEAKLNPQLS